MAADAGPKAITSTVVVADWTYKAAAVDAIFPGSPFERRFRDIHALSQQIQSRDAHYETVGQVLFRTPPRCSYKICTMSQGFDTTSLQLQSAAAK